MSVMCPAELSYEDHPWTGTLTPRLRDVWRYLQRVNSETPFYHDPEYFELAVRAGIVHPHRVVTLQHEGQPITLFPVQQRVPLVWETVRHFAQETSTVLIDPRQGEAVWRALGYWLAQHGQIGLLSLGLSTTLAHAAASGQLPQGMQALASEASPAVTIPLAANWEAFVARLGKSVRTKLRKIETHIQEIDPGMCVELLDDAERGLAAFDDLVRLYRDRWRNQVGGSMLCHPAHVAFYREALRWGLAGGTVIVPVLRLYDKAAVVGVVWHTPPQRSAYFHLIARDATALPPHWLNSPGTVLICHVIRWAMSRGVERLDMGQGNAHYKLLLGGTRSVVAARVGTLRCCRGAVAALYACAPCTASSPLPSRLPSPSACRRA